MELIEGADLAALVREQPLSAHRAAALLLTLAAAVQFAHANGVLHRDLKPSDILIDPFNQPRITDFGLAKPIDRDRDTTLSRQGLGSPAYAT